MNFERISALVIYIVGLGAYLASDLVITTCAELETINSWAKIRSLVGIVGIFCLLGLETLFVRSPHSSARLIKRLSIQIPLLAFPTAAIVVTLGFINSFWISYLLSISSAATIAIFQYYRSGHLLFAAQLTQQGWRIAAFIGISLMVFLKIDISINLMVIIAMIGSLAIAGLPIFFLFQPKNILPQNPQSFGELYRLSFRFMITSLFLALAIYSEQLLVQKIESQQTAAGYFTHATFFLFPAGVASGYLGFVLGPWVRDNHDRFVEIIQKKKVPIFFFLLVYIALLQLFGAISWSLLSPPIGSPDNTLRAFFGLVGIFITLYALPSAYNGVFASARHIDFLIFCQVAAFFISTVIFVALWKFLRVEPIYSVAIASLFNWTLRTMAGFAAIKLTLNPEGARHV